MNKENEKMKSINYTIIKKEKWAWVIKQDGSDERFGYTSKVEAFDGAKERIATIKGTPGRIKIHENGQYNSNWAVSTDNTIKKISGGENKGIVTLLKEQKTKKLDQNSSFKI